ncbi:hypothetical protein [Amycolatopsis benzoatilytica]|uniref:hypothetical protein n=1 Tax=Amycolatopsis benzoatilytica TaxID=346045 RepID=UPI000370589A|nr:hypothetical protein [Amycolatopsis benzoatilytica]
MKRRVWWIVGGVVVAAGIVGAVLEPDQPANPPAAASPAAAPKPVAPPPAAVAASATASKPAAPTSAAPDAAGAGEAAILAAAGPLHAHIENSNQLMCDASTATASADGRGIRVTLNFPGPGNVHAYIESSDGQHGEQAYTEGAQDAGHVFTFTEFPLKRADTVSVSVTAAAGSGTCNIVDRQG